MAELTQEPSTSSRRLAGACSDCHRLRTERDAALDEAADNFALLELATEELRAKPTAAGLTEDDVERIVEARASELRAEFEEAMSNLTGRFDAAVDAAVTQRLATVEPVQVARDVESLMKQRTIAKAWLNQRVRPEVMHGYIDKALACGAIDAEDAAQRHARLREQEAAQGESDG